MCKRAFLTEEAAQAVGSRGWECVCSWNERCLVGLEFRLTVWLVSKLEALLSMFVKGFNTKPRSLNVLLPSAQRPEKRGTCSALYLKDLQGAMKESLEEVGL